MLTLFKHIYCVVTIEIEWTLRILNITYLTILTFKCDCLGVFNYIKILYGILQTHTLANYGLYPWNYK